MREVVIPYYLWSKIGEISRYLIDELKLSEKAAEVRIKRMEGFVTSLSNPADYALCRFKKWRELGYRCAVFEKNWVFAYEVFEDGIIIRDMSHTATLDE
ncbi:MAG: hypothetical protein LBC84_06615 [Prevotellaceae bacterium]|jgi:hypothetical protein|nr:hypothetical protein [Prevotellaceae bacterium]